MKRPRLSLTDAAINDILEQADWYEQQSDIRLSKRWERAISQALHRIVQNPRSGSLCRFTADELQGLRRIPVAGFPKHLIFYHIEEDHFLILRVIHGARDLENQF